MQISYNILINRKTNLIHEFPKAASEVTKFHNDNFGESLLKMPFFINMPLLLNIHYFDKYCIILNLC